MKISSKYDVIIIGSGIGGLVCGSYLSKIGMKVLIIEKHFQAGGYCTSFTRKGHRFDSAVHSLRGIKEENQLGIVFKDLNLKNIISLERIDPSEIIIYKNKKICIHNDERHTVASFKSNFSTQKRQIDKFFAFLLNTDFVKLYKITNKKTFRDILNIFFNSNEIKTCFNILLGNLGLDSNDVSAFSSLIFLKELIKDGGYYPKGGIQAFPNALVKKLREYGGSIIFSTEARGIRVRNNSVEGVVIENENFLKSKIVVSNCDATNTYLNLIGKKYVGSYYLSQIKRLQVSPSAFIVYLGYGGNIINKYRCCTLWYFPSERSVDCYKNTFNEKVAIGNYAICGLSSLSLRSDVNTSNNSISITAIAPWKSELFWKMNKRKYAEKIIHKASEVLGDLSDTVDVKEVATPPTLLRYTGNHKGALYGWASLPDQISKCTMPQKSRIKGLYLCGHWATRGWGQGGVSMVANSGRTTADMIIKLCMSHK